ncbi:hypothetical protein V7O62_02355 [Methanolobus sp. ZRKC2]|uniref:hypothetical protein n=1 Tax=Methanolobus sp. ZRKC2 TaxID=3125783 RepID=UPI00324DF415
MNLGNGRTIVLLIVLCVSAALLGAASSYMFLGFDEPDYSADSEELHFSTVLITDELSHIIIDLEDTYPDNVIIENDEVVLKDEAIIEFDSAYFASEVDFDWNSMENQAEYITYIVDVDGIRYSQDYTEYYRWSGAVEELHISSNLLNDEINDSLNTINKKYPGSVTTNESEIVILGYEAYNEFDMSYFNTGLAFEWDSNSSEEQKVSLTIRNDDYVLHSADMTDIYRDGFYDPFLPGMSGKTAIPTSSYDHIIISYEELEGLLNGDNDTVQYFQETLDMHNELQGSNLAINIEEYND